MRINLLPPKPLQNNYALNKITYVNFKGIEPSDYVLPKYSAETSPVPINRWTEADELYYLYVKSIKEGDNSVFDILDSKDVTPDVAFSFLLNITKNEIISPFFIEELIKDEQGNYAPEKSRKTVAKLVKILGGKENFEKWYFDNNGYLKAFSRYTQDFYKNARSIQELYDFSPSWGAWAIQNKYNELKEEEGESIIKEIERKGGWIEDCYVDGYTIGDLPYEFSDKETYRQMIEELRYCCQRNLDLEEWANKYGFKNARRMNSGASAKFNILLDDKYVIKMQNFKDTNRGADYFNNLVDMTPDSVYLNSMVDYYTNKYAKNSSVEMYFYDNLTASAIYEYAKGLSAHFPTDETGINIRSEYFDSLFKKVSDIGINYTDYFGENYIQTKDGIKCIDSGHAIYSDLLKPQISGLQISLPCRTGLNPLELNSRLDEALSE